jgi:transcriptional regulator with XRE-family HTH domain
MNQIKKVMKNKGIEDIKPTDEVLESLGVKIHTWNKWVSGKKDPTITQLETISQFLGCKVSELIHNEHEGASL